MKYILLSLVMFVTAPFLLFSQANDEQAVRKTLEVMQLVLKNNDVDAAKLLLTDDFLLDAFGYHMNKEQRLASIQTGQFKYDPYKDEDVKVSLFGETAYVVIKTVVRYKSAEKDVSVDSATLTFVKKGEEWKLSGECYLGQGCSK